MMIQKFTQQLQSALKTTLQKDETIQVVEHEGDNGIRKVGLLVRKHGREDIQIADIENYYQSGDRLEHIVEDIGKIIHIQPGNKILKGNRSDWKCIRSQIIYRPINYSSNIESLVDMAYIQWQEFAIVFYMIELNGSGIYSVQVTQKDLNRWGIKKEELYQTAAKNTPRLFVLQIDNMHEILDSDPAIQFTAACLLTSGFYFPRVQEALSRYQDNGSA